MQLGLAAWHRYLIVKDPDLLAELVAEDAVFHSAIAHAPLMGQERVRAYLGAAVQVLAAGGFRYVRELVDGPEACLEFEAEIGGIEVNGIDLIRFDLAGRIADFKVMVRPMHAMEAVWNRMAELLENT